MKIFKFGGASLKNANAVINMGNIIDRFGGNELIVVVSAMGKTTNALESIFNKARNHDSYKTDLLNLIDFHLQIGIRLYGSNEKAESTILPVFEQLSEQLQNSDQFTSTDESYDRVIPYGELLSSMIVYEYLVSSGRSFNFLDAREYIITDERFRDAGIDWETTLRNINDHIIREKSPNKFITQGFIGKSNTGKMTTLGREGSDFSAAIFGSCLSAESITIWKDVPGIMNADPKRMPGTVLYKDLSYQESAEMSYYGATVIHPKTIKPLANKNIPLYVKSFEEPDLPGTVIHSDIMHNLPPAYIFKENQCLISFTRRDLEFINERNLGEIFINLDRLNLKINLMQNSAVSFTICVNLDREKVDGLVHSLSRDFKVLYNEDLHLITIKNYTNESIESISRDKAILLEQRTRNTYQIVTRN